MARPRGTDAAVTKRRILESALAMFGESGVDGASIRDIGARAGVTLATVHHYFGTKDELYAAVVDSLHRQLEELALSIMAGVNPGQPPLEQLGQIVRRCFHFAEQNRSAIGVLLRIVIDRGDVGERRLDDFQRPLLDRTVEVLNALTGQSPTMLRMHVQNMMFLVSRYTLSSLPERLMITGCTNAADATQTIENMLVATACQLLLARMPPAASDKPD